MLGRKDEAAALPLLQRAVTVIEGVVDTNVKSQLARMLGTLAQAQFRTGHAALARDTLKRMTTIYAQHRDLGPAVRIELAGVAREVSARS